ncbi:MAG: TldD/PmbA family protein [Armatimonadetes bacterium]|nr:TldD/PmbA family protein [Armatimonadota bacterium]
MDASQPSPRPLLERLLTWSSANHAEASYTASTEAATRFANNAITQNVARRSATVTVRVAFGRQVGRASVTDLSEESLRACVARAEELARASGPDSEFLPLPGPQSYPQVAGFDPEAAAADPAARAERIRTALGAARAAGVTAAGSCTTSSTLTAVANSAGLYHEQPLTDTQLVLTAMTADGSGWAQQSGYRLAELDPAACAARAIRKAQLSSTPRDLPPGEYPVVLEPAAAMDFFGFLAYTMDAKAAHEGRSAFSGREGTRIGAEGVTVRSQPDHPLAPICAAGEDGLPVPAVTWIRDGVLETLSYSRYWAEKSGRPFTGRPANLILDGGTASLEELIASVERGILVTRFWYIRFVDPMQLLLTGMTRDGLFWIEEGQVRHGLKNLRFNDSPLRALERVEARSPVARGGRYSPTCMPAMRLGSFQFSSSTAF